MWNKIKLVNACLCILLLRDVVINKHNDIIVSNKIMTSIEMSLFVFFLRDVVLNKKNNDLIVWNKIMIGIEMTPLQTRVWSK